MAYVLTVLILSLVFVSIYYRNKYKAAEKLISSLHKEVYETQSAIGKLFYKIESHQSAIRAALVDLVDSAYKSGGYSFVRKSMFINDYVEALEKFSNKKIN